MRRSGSNSRAASIAGDRRGTAAIEFAVAGVFFLMMLFAVIESSLLAANQLGVNRGLEAALRYGVVNGATACGGSGAGDLQPLFNAAAASLISGPLPGISVSCSPAGSSAAGTSLIISTSLAWSPVVFASEFGAITVSGSVSGVVLH